MYHSDMTSLMLLLDLSIQPRRSLTEGRPTLGFLTVLDCGGGQKLCCGFGLKYECLCFQSDLFCEFAAGAGITHPHALFVQASDHQREDARSSTGLM